MEKNFIQAQKSIIMHQPIYYIVFFTLATHVAIAQTKWIAHKSHSGNAENFGLITPGSVFEDDGSNFGRAPEPTVTMAQLDTVIRLSDRVAVMITSEYCQERRLKTEKRLWSAGRDTVQNHPLFCNNYSVSEIKRRLKRDYYFKNDVNSIIFIGFDTKPNPGPGQPKNPGNGQNQGQQQGQKQGQQQGQQQPNQQKQNGGQENKAEILPLSIGDDHLTPPASTGLSTDRLFLFLLGISVIAGGISWYKNRNSSHEKMV